MYGIWQFLLIFLLKIDNVGETTVIIKCINFCAFSDNHDENWWFQKRDIGTSIKISTSQRIMDGKIVRVGGEVQDNCTLLVATTTVHQKRQDRVVLWKIIKFSNVFQTLLSSWSW